ncbi:LacI family DNA-binding transcriptional regulator [Tessaracoccus sp. MC1627]|uniref:LacI family DNA-binding transcriptional regulator n=1 Tax=Tessaracoccus sp. MC1627 TaxID=2760312 RepID=UPI0016035C69|nr:LacI family DNA-binding transcriptional regulator [Tessaracoccus sp. MC1627]MBB1511096.1 LacI family DNA-binding transcriptional regulator [Tessaracoccus sp. MC1627]
MARDQDGRPSLASVARAAGVSISTASRALTGRGDLKPETRQRVLSVAYTLDYHRPSTRGGRPAVRDPRVIELVLGSFDDAWTAAVTTGAREAAFGLGYDLGLTLERDDPADDWPVRVASRRPSGIIVGIIVPTRSQREAIRGLGIPMVLLDPRAETEDALASVGTSDWLGGFAAGTHLAECGAERFVVVAGVPRLRFGRAREEGFRAAIQQRDPNAPIRRINGQWSDSPVTSEMLHILGEGSGRVGVFACNDEMALAVYTGAGQLGLRIPEDVLVVGFNDEPRAASASPPLTSVRQPLEQIAGRAVELVHELRGHSEDKVARVELPTTLIVRASTGA